MTSICQTRFLVLIVCTPCIVINSIIFNCQFTDMFLWTSVENVTSVFTKTMSGKNTFLICAAINYKMFAVKNEHLLIYLFAFTTIFLFLSNLTNKTNGKIEQIYPKRSSKSYLANGSSDENLVDLMIEKLRENFVVTEIVKPKR